MSNINSDRPDLKNRIRNSSYIFVPFICNHNVSHLSIEEYWKVKNQNNKYFLKYIVDKMSPDSNAVCCRPYLMDDNLRRSLGIVESSQNCFLETTKYTEKNNPFAFQINEISLFLFETNIGFIIYKIEHDTKDSAYRIASKNYHLKKVHSTSLYTQKADGVKSTLVVGSASITSLSELSSYILEKTVSADVDIFFNYCEKPERRSNILTHYNLNLDHNLNEKDDKDIDNVLFYLKRNYHHQWMRDKSDVISSDEYFKASPYIRWGITSEATICLTITDPSTFFVSNSFYDNFHTHYLYIYILALHQKYALYHFLTKFNAESDIVQLETCLFELADFRAKYVFQVVSESETYQTVYSKARASFSLDHLFIDIDEQVRRIVDIKRTIKDKKDTKQENRITLVISLLAFFSLFSALVDVNSLINWFDWLLTAEQIALAQKIATSILVISAIYLFIQFAKASYNRKKAKTRKAGGK